MVRKVYCDKKEFFEQNAALGTDLPYSDDVSVLKEGFTIGGKQI